MRFVGRLFAIAAICLTGGAAFAQEAPEDRPLGAEELSELRAGYLSVDGLRFDFAAEIRTTVDGQAVLISRIVWTPEGPRYFDAQGAQVAAPEGGLASLLVPGSGGDTLVGHRLSDGQLQGFVVNSASGRDVRQNLDITVSLPGFETIQRDMLQTLTGLQIGRDVAAGLVRSSNAP